MGLKQLNNNNLRKFPNEYGDVSVMQLRSVWSELVGIQIVQDFMRAQVICKIHKF